MKSFIFKIIVPTLLVVGSTARSRAGEVPIERFELANGMNVLIAHSADATEQATFTFLPVTLVNDGREKGQWSHLLEHMIIRSTDPASLHSDGIEVNGETTHMYLRLDTYAKADRWQQSLAKHAQWLSARTFEPAILEREKGVIASEEQTTAANGATTKFALAAWNQVHSHGLAHVGIHSDVAEAQVTDVQAYAAARVPVDQSVLIATIGPTEPTQVRGEIERVFGALPRREAPKPQVTSAESHADGAKLHATWDLPTRHAVWWWVLPNQTPATLGAATLVARSLQVQYQMKPKRDLRVRQLIVYPCIVTPRGAFFVVDACLSTGSDVPNLLPNLPIIKQDEVVADLRTIAGALRANEPGHQMLGWMASTMVQETPYKPEFADIRKKLQPAVRGKAEAMWLVAMMNYEYLWNLPAHIAVGATQNVNPEALQTLLERLRNPPTGTLELEPAPAPEAPATKTD